MAVTLAFTFSEKTVDGETVTFTDGTTYSDPARSGLVLIMRAYHLDQDLTATRKELNAYDPTSVTSWTLSLDQTSSSISPIDGVHKIILFALTSEKYGGLSGGKYQINSADEESYTDAQLTALSEDTHEAYILPTPKLWQEETQVYFGLSDHGIDLDVPALNLQANTLKAKRVGAWAQFQLENYSSAAAILEQE